MKVIGTLPLLSSKTGGAVKYSGTIANCKYSVMTEKGQPEGWRVEKVDKLGLQIYKSAESECFKQCS